MTTTVPGSEKFANVGISDEEILAITAQPDCGCTRVTSERSRPSTR